MTLSERAAAQSHFQDLCRLFEHPDPIAADPKGEWFTFEKGIPKAGGGDGFADVWKRGCFAWEYKKKKRNLDDALGQLARYALALESPPLHIACDTDRFRIVTAWTNHAPKSYDLALDDLLVPEKLDLLRSAFHRPEQLKPGDARADLTKSAADKFSLICSQLLGRGDSAEAVAHFVSRLVFLFFAEDVRLLPGGYFRRVLGEMAARPGEATDLLSGLFSVLRKGGRFGLDRLPHVNGGLFDATPALSLDEGGIRLLVAAGRENWAHIDPTIFGTLFERFLDPAKRAQIGAHYTDAAKIMMLLEPVLLRPLREEWANARNEIEALVERALKKGARSNDWTRAEERRSLFLERLRTLSVLDPACGSANFLYLALQGVKNLEHTANQECEALGLPPRMPAVGPEIVHGIEINPLAAELARTTIWIGDIQWGVQNGFYGRAEPILRPLDAIECRDALLTSDGSEATWPTSEFIVGNPPFLGGKLLRNGLGDETVHALFRVYDGRVPREADLVTYWFEKARAAVTASPTCRVGFVSTNSIRGGANRRVLERVAKDAPIFEAWSDEPWVVDGAAVRVSLVCFGQGDGAARLNGEAVATINVDLSAVAADLTRAKRLAENANAAFMGDTKGGAFDLPGDLARTWLQAPLNPNGRPNSDVLKPWIHGADIADRLQDKWIVDFGWRMTEAEAAFYDGPFSHVQRAVRSKRSLNRREIYAKFWWRHVEPRQGMWAKLDTTTRYIATIRHSKHRLFEWFPTGVVPDSALIAIAREDDTTFGILHSRFHEAWSLRLCTWLGVGNDPRYTPTTTFETFPFPEGLTPNIPATFYANDPRAIRIARAAKHLDSRRRAWLNPSDLVRIEPEVVPGYPDRILPKDARAAAILKDRTLTNLYNERPTWLANAHAELDRAVAAAYGWPEDIALDEALEKLLQLNLTRSAPIAAACTLSTAGTQDA